MAQRRLYRIDNIDVTSFLINSEEEEEWQDLIDFTKMVFSPKITTAVTVNKFSVVQIWETFDDLATLEQDSNRIFFGLVAKREIEPAKHTIMAYSNLWKAIQTKINFTYDRNIDASAGRGSEIFKDLATRAGLNFDDTTIQDTGTNLLLDKFNCNNAEIFERMQTLAIIYNYQIYYRSDVDRIYFEPVGFSSNVNDLIIGGVGTNVNRTPRWSFDSTKFFNVINLRGLTQSINREETFVSAGETEFTLQFVPETVRVLVNGTEQTGGVEGSTVTFDYAVDQDQRKIIFQSGSIPSVSDTILVNYSYNIERIITRKNLVSISELGREIEQDITFRDLLSVEDAINRAKNLLELYSKDFTYTKLEISPISVRTLGLMVGQQINVNDTFNNISGLFLIKKLKRTYPNGRVDVSIGDREIKLSSYSYDYTKRIERLEQELSAGTEFNIQSIDLQQGLRIRSKSIEIGSYTYPTNVLIWNHPRQGTWNNSFVWHDGSAHTYTQIFFRQN